MGHNKTALGARIRQARRDNGLTQDELARLLGVEQSYISSIERGRKSGGHETLARIAQALHVSLDELTGIGAVPEFDDDGLSPGLRGLARDHALLRSMSVTDDEIQALASLQPPRPLSRDAYIQILLAMRHGAMV